MHSGSVHQLHVTRILCRCRLFYGSVGCFPDPHSSAHLCKCQSGARLAADVTQLFANGRLAEALLSLQGKFLPTSVENLWRKLQSVLNHTSAVLPAHTHQRVFHPVKAGWACLK